MLRHLGRARNAVFTVLAIVIVALAASAGFALKAQADSNTVYYACVSAKDGSLYSVGTSAPTCKPADTQINWNQQGPVGPAGPQGDTGATGATGPQGPAGANGVSGYEIVSTNNTIPAFGAAEGDAYCPTGKVAIGGGFVFNNGSDNGAQIIVDRDAPTGFVSGNGYGWEVSLFNSTSNAYPNTVYAVCALAN